MITGSDTATVELLAVGATNRTGTVQTVHSIVIDEEKEEILYWGSNEVESGDTWGYEFEEGRRPSQYTVRVRVNDRTKTAHPHEWGVECTWATAHLEQPENELQLSIPEAHLDCDNL